MSTSHHDDSPQSSATRPAWIVAAIVLAAALFWIAINNELYAITSPRSLSFHVLLRKAYSIAAFTLIGFTAAKALGGNATRAFSVVVLVAAYSGAIEVAQLALGSLEGLAWNVVDILCGALGGWLGVVGARIKRSRRRA